MQAIRVGLLLLLVPYRIFAASSFVSCSTPFQSIPPRGVSPSDQIGTRLMFSSCEIDTNHAVSGGNNDFFFTVPTNGVYQIETNVQIAPGKLPIATAAGQFALLLVVDGSAVRVMGAADDVLDTQREIHGSITRQLNAGQKIRIYLQNNTAVQRDLMRDSISNWMTVRSLP